MRTLRFGSRKSLLAVAQTRLVMEAIKKRYPEITLELVTMETTGDRNMKPFSEASDKFGIKGLFTQELEEALLQGKIDVAVHSLKDMPVHLNPDLPLAAYFHRGDPRDALVLPATGTERREKAAGCSSARRRIQLLRLFPGWTVEPLRGNVVTRLKKLDEGRYSALVLAAAGLCRLSLENRISRCFSVSEMIPAPGQGILTCQTRADAARESWLDAVRDSEAADCAAAERSFSAALGGGCAAPVGAYAEISGTEMKLRGFYADEPAGICAAGVLTGCRAEARRLGEVLALKLKNERR